MTEPSKPKPAGRREPLDDEAARWLARMRGPDADASRAAFDRWLAQGDRHRAAYNRAGNIWSMGKVLSDDAAAMRLDETATAASSSTRGAGIGRLAVAIILAAACLIAIVAYRFVLVQTPADWVGGIVDEGPGQSSPDGAALSLRTARAETRSVRLADGSAILLGPASRLTIRFDGDQRRLQLEQGQARFDVAHDRRPFVVAAGNGTVTALGTLFDVTMSGHGRVVVHLLRGSVEVAAPLAQGREKASDAVRRLAPGEQIAYADRAPGLVKESPFEFLAPPAAGAMEFDDARLDEVVAIANQRNSRRLRIDPALAALRVSGRFRTHDPGQLADHLAATLDLKVRQGNQNDLVLTKR